MTEEETQAVVARLKDYTNREDLAFKKMQEKGLTKAADTNYDRKLWIKDTIAILEKYDLYVPKAKI